MVPVNNNNNNFIYSRTLFMIASSFIQELYSIHIMFIVYTVVVLIMKALKCWTLDWFTHAGTYNPGLHDRRMITKSTSANLVSDTISYKGIPLLSMIWIKHFDSLYKLNINCHFLILTSYILYKTDCVCSTIPHLRLLRVGKQEETLVNINTYTTEFPGNTHTNNQLL